MVRRTEDRAVMTHINPEASRMVSERGPQPVGYKWGTQPVQVSERGGGYRSNNTQRDDKVGLVEEEEKAYGMRLGFPTDRRPTHYTRTLVKAPDAKE